MAIRRESPKCVFCGEVIAKEVHIDQSHLPPEQRLIGDTFLHWENIEHECEGAKKFAEKYNNRTTPKYNINKNK